MTDTDLETRTCSQCGTSWSGSKPMPVACPNGCAPTPTVTLRQLVMEMRAFRDDCAREAMSPRVSVGLAAAYNGAGLRAQMWAEQLEAAIACKRCAATVATDPPMDCNWPYCGCDPIANRVLEAVESDGRFVRKD